MRGRGSAIAFACMLVACGSDESVSSSDAGAVDSGADKTDAATDAPADTGVDAFVPSLVLRAGGSGGSVDGTGADARFNNPAGVAVDGAGNVFVADEDNSIVRKITSAGVVTTLAGTALAQGSADGAGAAASFRSPAGVAVDSAGNVFVADSNNSTIRKITSAGVITTLAGYGIGSDDGTGVAASFANPFAVSVDGAGNVFVADTGNHTIRKITSAGVVTTLAGTAGAYGSADGTGAAARRCLYRRARPAPGDLVQALGRGGHGDRQSRGHFQRLRPRCSLSRGAVA